jgi:hypothetical protein
MMSGRCYFDHGAHLCLHCTGANPKSVLGVSEANGAHQWRSPAVLKLDANFSQLTHHVFDQDQSETVPSYRSL